MRASLKSCKTLPDSSRIHRLSLSCAQCCMQEYTGDHGEANKGTPFNFEGAQLKEDGPCMACMRFTPRNTEPALFAGATVGFAARTVKASRQSIIKRTRTGSGTGITCGITCVPGIGFGRTALLA